MAQFFVYRNLDVNTTGALISAGPHSLMGYYMANIATSVRYVKFYDKATAPSVGTDTPVMTIPLPAGGAANLLPGGIGWPFTLGLGIGATTAAADVSTAAPAANDVIVNLVYN